VKENQIYTIIIWKKEGKEGISILALPIVLGKRKEGKGGEEGERGKKRRAKFLSTPSRLRRGRGKVTITPSSFTN